MPELTCPVCGGALHREERSLRCGAGHCYDIARQGYVNLLRTNRSKDKRHGDDKRMVAARTAFLDAGYYAPLRDAVAAAATEYTSGDAGVLDAGCGEGYYTAHVLHTLQAQGKSPSVCGVDISRDALNIDPDELMERFVRGDSSRTTEGSGLGLNIAKSLVELQKGTFSIAIDGDLFKASVALRRAE